MKKTIMVNYMERVNVYLGLGSNLGERELNLLKAVNLLDEAFGTHPERISRIVETPSWGFDGPAFLNFCVLYRLPRTGNPEDHAMEILHKVKEVEEKPHTSSDMRRTASLCRSIVILVTASSEPSL